MTQEVVKSVQSLFENSCNDLFVSLNCYIRETDVANNSLCDAPVAYIDAGSDDISLVIALQLPMTVLSLSYPVPGSISEVSEEILEDWINELSNQLIGRLKAKMLNHNQTLQIGLPASYFDSDISEVFLEDGEVKTFYFEIDGEVCVFHLSVKVFNENLNYTLEVNEETESIAEGDIELF